MDFLEKDLEQIIWETGDDILSERGLPIFGKRYRQLRIGNYGRADLVTFWRNGETICFNVFELKKDKVDIQTLLQAAQYVKGISTYLKTRGFNSTHHITLVGKSLDSSTSFCFLPDIFPSLSVYSYKLDINGLNFIRASDYNLRYSGFNTVCEGPF